jgi:hypothetical protein
MTRTLRLASAFALPALFAATSDAQTAGSEPAARGLDVFIHAPELAPPRAMVPVQIEAFGFPTVVSLVPLGGAAVEAAWDPEHLGPGVSVAPPPVRATTDAAGRAHLEVPVPDGDERELKLLVGLRSGSHERTRTITVRRGPLTAVALHVADTRVVPGSAISTWVLVTSAAGGDPVANARVELSLLEGGFARHKIQLVTDAAGTAMTRVPIPRTEEPTWRWELRARTLGTGKRGAGEAEVTLTPREETPGSPRMWATWGSAGALAGDRVPFTVRVRDAADQPVQNLAVRTWTGPKGTLPPKDEEQWEKVARSARTDARGEITGEADAPSTVVRGVGTTLRLVARASVDGHPIEQSAVVPIGVPSSSAALLPEGGSIVPGIEQRMLLRVLDGRHKPVAAEFAIAGDGLDATVTTDANGEAEVTWRPPAEVGALHNVGACAGGVATAVRVRPTKDVPALAPRREPFALCVPVDRDATAVIRLDRPAARVGDRVRVRVIEAAGKPGRAAKSKPAWSVVVRSENGQQAASLWIEDGEAGAEFEVPPGAPGAWSLSAAAPELGRAARVIGGELLVTPRTIPVLAARVGAGRAAPGGALEIDADLTDGQGHGIPGSVAAVVVDLNGGGSASGLELLDTRRSICASFGVEDGRCARFVEGDQALDPLRRALLGGVSGKPLAPANDPGGNAGGALTKTFGEVLRSLEGAVFEASGSADRLRDVRRKAQGGWAWNPELLTLVTGTMSPEPLTPGGEPLTLADLIAVDPQVTFNHVARRIARFKLFHVLAAVRTFRREGQVDPDGPIFKNPNAILRRLVRENKLTEETLLDPWGGTIQFVPSAGPPVPFLTVVRGFELHAPGPDGIAGSGDDVRDPFERVLRSGTPYAKAVDEDRLVDAKLDVEVGDATVAAWQTLFASLTGTMWGNSVGESFGAGGLGLSGVGEGGGGRGEGIGIGRIGRLSMGVPTGVAFWSPPQRTDARGHLRIHVPLGDVETTWRIALVAVADGGRRATTHVDVPVSLPLSVRIDTGATWVEGDVVKAALTVRNRTPKPIRATLTASASGAAGGLRPDQATRTVDVPAGGATTTAIEVTSAQAGTASLDVTARAPDLPDDTAHHTWEVIAAGEPTDLTRAQWVEGSASLELAPDKPGAIPFVRLVGAPRLVLERGFEDALLAALDSLDPDRTSSPAALADAIEVAARLQRWALTRGGEGSAAALRAAEIGRRARGRLAVHEAAKHPVPWAALRRARVFALSEAESGPAPAAPAPECPPSPSGEDAVGGLDAEPAPTSGTALACWNAFVSSTLDEVNGSGDPLALARAVLALAERPSRAASAASLVDRLREQLKLRPSGAIVLPPNLSQSRAARAVVFAALLRGARLGKPSPAPAERLAAWIGVQRDADGGYGSSMATRHVVQALLGSDLEEKGTTTVVVTAGEVRRELSVGSSARVVVPLPPGTTGVKIKTEGPGLVARLERPVLRLWSHPPDAAESPLHLDVAWPTDAAAGRHGVVRIDVRHGLGRATPIDLRLPLPPGVTLAEKVSGVQEVQGALRVRRTVDGSELPTTIEVPVRFGLAGRVTVPEARATVAFEEIARAVAPARPLVIR